MSAIQTTYKRIKFQLIFRNFTTYMRSGCLVSGDHVAGDSATVEGSDHMGRLRSHRIGHSCNAYKIKIICETMAMLQNVSFQ